MKIEKKIVRNNQFFVHMDALTYEYLNESHAFADDLNE